MKRILTDIAGQRFGRLIVQWPVGISGKHNKYWLCLCDCGSLHVARAYDLGNGISSCGCLRSENSKLLGRKIGKINLKHGHSIQGRVSREYHSWMAMRNRCYNPKTVFYERYGGLGVTVSDRWNDSFENFLADMGPRPEGKSLDRYPNPYGNYEPGNCRWATAVEQRHNRRELIHSTASV